MTQKRLLLDYKSEISYFKGVVLTLNLLGSFTVVICIVFKPISGQWSIFKIFGIIGKPEMEHWPEMR